MYLQHYFVVVPQKDGSIVNPFFGRRYGSSFKGFANGDPGHTYTVITNINRNSVTLAQGLNRANRTPNYWRTQSGLTLGDDFKGGFGLDYVASDVAGDPIHSQFDELESRLVEHQSGWAYAHTRCTKAVTGPRTPRRFAVQSFRTFS
jgi:hypothetical protein